MGEGNFSTKNAILRELDKPNSIVFINKKGYTVSMQIDLSKITFSLKKHATKPYIMKITGTHLGTGKSKICNIFELKSSDFIIPRKKFLTLETILIIVMVSLLIIGFIVWFIFIKKKQPLEEDESDLISSFIDD